jgi:hypothetical protein
MCGTDKGDIVLVRYGDFKVTWRKNICSAEIISVKSYTNRAVIGSADGSVYFWNYTSNILQGEPVPTFNKINLTYSVTSLHFDPEGI